MIGGMNSTTPPSLDEIIRLLREHDAASRQREEEIYQRGWKDAVAHIVATASQGGPIISKPTLRQTPRREPLTPERPIILVVEDIIREEPGLRGADIFRRVVQRVPGADFKTMDRTGRTALARLQKRGKIRNRNKRWYPINDQPALLPADPMEEKN